MSMKRTLVLCLLLCPAPVLADPIFYYDGQSHDVDTPTMATYDVTSGSHLNVLPGAELNFLSVGGLAGDTASATMTGGQVDNGISVAGVNTASDPVRILISGGQVRGADGLYGVNGLRGNGDVTATITGGTFTGGDSTDHPGSGVAFGPTQMGQIFFHPTLNISGGTFLGGTASSSGNAAPSLSTTGGITTITGGHFLGPIAIGQDNGTQVSFLGTNLTYHDHILSGMLQNGDTINVPIVTTFYNPSNPNSYPYPDGGVIVNPAGTEVQFVPEPMSGLVFGLLAAVGLTYRSRNRRPC